jgi:hypothetical protein
MYSHGHCGIKRPYSGVLVHVPLLLSHCTLIPRELVCSGRSKGVLFSTQQAHGKFSHVVRKGASVSTTRTRGRGLWADDKRNSEPVYELLAAMCKQAHKDIERATRLGERATREQLAARASAEQFLQEVRRQFT